MDPLHQTIHCRSGEAGMTGIPNLPKVKTHDDENDTLADQKSNGRGMQFEWKRDGSRPNT